MSEKCQCKNTDCPSCMFPEPDSEALPPVAGSISLRVGDYARCLVPLKKPGKWGNRSIIVRNVTVTGIVGQYVQVRVPGRDGTVAVPREDIQDFWRHENGVMSRSNDRDHAAARGGPNPT